MLAKVQNQTVKDLEKKVTKIIGGKKKKEAGKSGERNRGE